MRGVESKIQTCYNCHHRENGIAEDIQAWLGQVMDKVLSRDVRAC